MREALSAIVGDDPRKCRHPGHPALWIGAYVGDLRSDLTKSGVVKKAAAWTPDGAYEAAYEAWKKAITDEHTHVEEMVAASPVIVGLAAETPIETSITLHYPYGVPIIPGSALKGLARSYARLAVSQREGGEALAEGGEACKFLFGTQEQAGQVTFLDAWWAPTAGVKPLHQDVMTPHHSRYYSSQGRESPADTEDPVPVNFLHAKGRFLVAVRCAREEWREFAFRLLVAALADWGVGAKTAAGYGRLELTPGAKWPPAVDKPFLCTIQAMTMQEAKSEGRDLFKQAMEQPAEATRREALVLLHAAFKSAGMLKSKWISEKPARAWITDEFLPACHELGIGGDP